MTPPEPAPPYRGEVAALATRHGKEVQVGPALAAAGLRVVVADVDTDAFGAFTGEVARRGTPLEVALHKARAGMAVAGTRLGLASEGSFGPHPDVPLLVADHELVVLVDDLHGTLVVEEAVGLDTPAVTREVIPGEDLSGLCAAVGFPAQALIARPADGTGRGVTKGIREPAVLARAVLEASAASGDGRARVEPDLRAHACPTRRLVISRAARQLASRLACRCPRCGVPGFGGARPEPGLPCGICESPTSAPAATLLDCPRCDHRERRVLTGTADPATCTRCNP